MSRIFLMIDPSAPYTASLTTALQRRGHQVCVFYLANVRVQTITVEIQRSDPHVVLFDLTQSGDGCWNTLRTLAQVQRANGLPVPVLCYSQIYRGPCFELKVEHFGARLVYAG
jgi:ActR/RegA family two-component response regulator